ncbi:hypothetical protein OESDEN_22408, partial [Oesophagostomum dentatum]
MIEKNTSNNSKIGEILLLRSTSSSTSFARLIIWFQITGIGQGSANPQKRRAPASFPILRMMHKETDVIGIMIYYVLVPLKFVVVFVLRKDVRSVFSQIVYLRAP